MVELLILAGVVIVVMMIVGFVLKLVTLALLIGSWMAAGYLAGQLMRGESYGFVGDTALGFVGAIVGSLVLGIFGLGYLGHLWLIGHVIASTVGAVIILFFKSRRQEKKTHVRIGPNLDQVNA